MEPPAPEHRYFLPSGERTVLDFVIEDFPFPLAITYARLQQEMDRQDPVAAVWQLRDAYEVAIKFTASVAARDALVADDGDSGDIAKTLLDPQGLTLGKWWELLNKALKPLLQLGRGGHLHASRRVAPDLVAVFRDPQKKWKPTAIWDSINGDRDGFIAWRNDTIGHGVFQVDRRKYADDTLTRLEHLHAFYRALRPVLDQKTVVEVLPDGREVEWRGASDLPFVGRHEHVPAADAHPLFIAQRGRAGGNRLELTPLVSIHQCGVCSQPAAFFYDKQKRANTHLREYAQGHSHRMQDWSAIADLAGLIGPDYRWEQTSYDLQAIELADKVEFRAFDGYLPPDYLFDAIWRAIAGNHGPYIHLTAPEGTGKTFLVRGLQDAASVQEPLLVLPYHIRRGDLATYQTFLSRLQAMLDDPRLGIVNVPNFSRIPAETGLDGMRKAFAAYLEVLASQRSVLLALDGLDELPEPDRETVAITDLLPDPVDMPENCFVLVTSRETVQPGIRRGLDRISAGVIRLQVDPGAPGNQGVIRAWLGQNLPEQFRAADQVEAVLERSGGVFLYAFHLARALESGAFADTTTLPLGVDFYPAYLARIREQIGATLYEGSYLQPMLLLVAAHSPVTRDQLVRWGVPGDRLDPALVNLKEFLRVRRGPAWHDSLRDDGEARYELAHEAFARFVQDDPDLSERLRAAHETIAQTALNTFDGRWETFDPYDAADLYDLCETPSHLALAGLEPVLDTDRSYASACWSGGSAANDVARHEIALLL